MIQYQCVISRNISMADVTDARCISCDVHSSTCAYHRDTTLDNVIFCNQRSFVILFVKPH